MIQSGGIVLKGIEWQGTTAELDSGFFRSGLTAYWASYASMYRDQQWVRTVVDKRAKATARLPLKVYERDDLNRPEARDHPYALLLRRPNERYSAFFFWLWMSSTFDTFGETFAGKLRDRGGRPIGLVPLHPTAMHPEEERDGRTIWRFENGRVRITGIPDEDLFHPRTFNPDSFVRGLSPLESLRRTLENEDAARRATSAFWRNGARPGVLLQHPGVLSDGAANRLKVGWEALTAGADKTGTTVVLEEGMKAEKLMLTAEEAQYIESRKLNREEVCAVYDVPPPVVHILDRATFCLPAEALVETSQGPIPIAEVEPGAKVWAFDGQALRQHKVTWAGSTGIKPLYTVRTATRTLRATANHPVLVARRPHLSGEGNRRRYGAAEFAWVRVDELAVGDLVVAAHGFDAHEGTTIAPNGRRLTEGFMEFVGLVMGDGSVLKTGVSIAHACNARYIQHYLDVASEEFRQRGGRPIHWQRSGRSSRFSSANASRELTDLGFAGTAHRKTVPGWVFETAPSLRLAFLRGFMDADGSVDKKGRLSLALCNRLLTEQVRHLCMGLGIPVTNSRSTTVEVRLPNGRPFKSTSYGFTCSDPGANGRIGTWDPSDAARILAGKPFSLAAYSYADRSGRAIEPPTGGRLARVCAIDFDPDPVEVFDLTVDGAHSFVADGLVVHNSNITEQMRSMYRDTMAPHLRGFEAELEHQVRGATRPGSDEPDFGDDVYAEFLLDEVLRGDFEARQEAYSKADYMTMAEKRRAENLPYVEGTDVILVNGASVPVAGPDAPRLSPTSTAEEGPELEPVLSPEQARSLIGRLSRPKSLGEVDATAFTSGLGAAQALHVRAALNAAKATGDTVAIFRERIKRLGGHQ